ncbi:hypothetical protein BLA24_01700 [Streptomyces cinnamoneus]|uniref:Uncharacterized protein n=1 Tax=Streptomyces cinnamoneus TaxID=53446 RepID=A0A2G1XQ58_STRCJ|nr:hypothetical protein [Streptomyces cinnamoneus]PHQ49442.1 hypothetical protein BLA24_25720 [Streptomyces cinnamoneus]PHQ53362.1 hypothetical protein BLA24_01665 [Streptomyces cinnamoneus]PHQ53369.1 hypothetical protein BLA24_01700 [Streptomyces cinnamoneus]PPT14908.1 hypothetical protein CYQ11_20350 [Streptomyces cinnamoneus]
MKHSEKALANGWGWVLGVSGEECRVYSRPAQQAPAEDPAELLGRVTKLLGLDDPSQVPAAIRTLQEDRKKALASAATAWNAVHELTRRPSGGKA